MSDVEEPDPALMRELLSGHQETTAWKQKEALVTHLLQVPSPANWPGVAKLGFSTFLKGTTN